MHTHPEQAAQRQPSVKVVLGVKQVGQELCVTAQCLRLTVKPLAALCWSVGSIIGWPLALS